MPKIEHSPNCVLVFSDFLNTEGTKYQIASDELLAKQLQEQQETPKKPDEPLTDAQKTAKQGELNPIRDAPKIGTHRTAEKEGGQQKAKGAEGFFF